MEQILINLVAGALGGVGVGKSLPTFDLGMIGNIISGLIGGGVLGQIVTLLLPAITRKTQQLASAINPFVSTKPADLMTADWILEDSLILARIMRPW